MRKVGDYVNVCLGNASYKAYKPNILPSSLDLDNELISLLNSSYILLGKLDELVNIVPNIYLFISSYVRKEALLSSQIEGTQATLEDILDPNVETSTSLDITDVVNYTKAIYFAINELESLPICKRLLCESHKILLSNTRGNDKNPGEYRHSQNWIGSSSSSINNAKYVPPTVDDMNNCMSDLEKYINEVDIDPLIKIGLTHYQFETIHPFLDGNGRIGRLLIILMLIKENLLSQPILYISYFFKSNQFEYYEKLNSVRLNNDYKPFLKFFLNGIIYTCKDTISTIKEINSIFINDENKLNKSHLIYKIYEYIKVYPIFNISQLICEFNISYNGIKKCINKLIELDIVDLTNKDKKRNRTFMYKKYLNVLKSSI